MPFRTKARDRAYWLIVITVGLLIFLVVSGLRTRFGLGVRERFEQIVVKETPVDPKKLITMDEDEQPVFPAISNAKYYEFSNSARNGTFRITDAYSFYHDKKNYKESYLVTALPYSRFFMIMEHSPFNSGVMPFKTLNGKSKSIGFHTEAEKQCFEMFLIMHNLDRTNFTYKQITSMSKRETDLVVRFMPHDYSSSRIKDVNALAGNVTIYDYMTNLEMDKVRFFIPFCIENSFDFGNIFADHKSFYRIVSCISFTLMVYAPRTEEWSKAHNELMQSFDSLTSETSFLSMFMNLHPKSNDIIQHVYSRNDKDLREEFDQKATVDDRSSNVTIHVPFIESIEYLHSKDGDFKQLVVNQPGKLKLANIPIKKGDRIILSQQRYHQENGEYWISYVGSDKIVMDSHRTITFLEYSNDVPDFVSGVPSPEMPPGIRVGEAVYVVNMNAVGNVLEVSKDMVVIRVRTAPKRFQIGAHEGECVTNPRLLNKSACESNFNDDGSPKSKLDVWDAPCKNDTDCPFFQANKNYKNMRGGCHSGYCEFPVGVKRLSYRKYSLDNDSFPYCHGCSVTQQGAGCCADQENVKDYPKLKSPDYAFANDLWERYATMKG
jgi:hypothetical protein